MGSGAAKQNETKQFETKQSNANIYESISSLFDTGKMASTGDGLSVETSHRSDGGAAGSTDGDMGSRVASLMAKHGTAKTIAPQKSTVLMSKVYSAFAAKTKEQKAAVDDVLTYLAIVHGCGPNVAWETIPASPDGCKELMMNEIVDKIITRANHRKFMGRFSARAVQMFDSSPELQLTLSERAVRNGLALTDSLCVIDFLDASSGINSNALALRAKSKYSAVARANGQSAVSTERDSAAASEAMHHHRRGSIDSLG